MPEHWARGSCNWRSSGVDAGSEPLLSLQRRGCALTVSQLHAANHPVIRSVLPAPEPASHLNPLLDYLLPRLLCSSAITRLQLRPRHQHPNQPPHPLPPRPLQPLQLPPHPLLPLPPPPVNLLRRLPHLLEPPLHRPQLLLQLAVPHQPRVPAVRLEQRQLLVARRQVGVERVGAADGGAPLREVGRVGGVRVGGGEGGGVVAGGVDGVEFGRRRGEGGGEGGGGGGEGERGVRGGGPVGGELGGDERGEGGALRVGGGGVDVWGWLAGEGEKEMGVGVQGRESSWDEMRDIMCSEGAVVG